MNWSEKDYILIFLFEAFDESWKGSNEPLDPEKYWGLLTVDRKQKLVVKGLFPI